MPPKAALKPAKKALKNADKKKTRKQGAIEEEGASENMDDDIDVMNMDQNN